MSILEKPMTTKFPSGTKVFLGDKKFQTNGLRSQRKFCAENNKPSLTQDIYVHQTTSYIMLTATAHWKSNGFTSLADVQILKSIFRYTKSSIY